jgi:hypothetical protein
VAMSRYIVSIVTVIVAAALVSGCGGSQLSPQGPAQAGSAQAFHSPIAMPQVKDHCPAHGGVRATPCIVDLSASAPGPDTVTIRAPKDKKGTLSESDDCGGPSGVATVTPGSAANQWVVTAGGTTGSCTATFDYLSYKKGKVLGHADVGITNSI